MKIFVRVLQHKVWNMAKSQLATTKFIIVRLKVMNALNKKVAYHEVK